MIDRLTLWERGFVTRLETFKQPSEVTQIDEDDEVVYKPAAPQPSQNGERDEHGELLEEIRRPTKPLDGQMALFEVEPDWRHEWWGMPEFTHGDATAQHQITMNFSTREDLMEFAKKLDLKITTRSNSCWYPQNDRLSGDIYYDGDTILPRYPICIPSKGRADYQKTAQLLDRMKVPYKVFVESDEYDAYRRKLPESKLVSMPFNNLGQGSIPARNFIWEWAKERGHKRHWCMDDNMVGFARLNANRRIRVKGGGFFAAMEDFADRYENVALCGPHDQGFAPDRQKSVGKPYIMNTRIYSCILIDTNLEHRWRGRYNEDTDLSLRCLKDGLCTVLFYALLMAKPGTVGSKTKAMPGGNTDNVYNTGDHRLAFAKSLQEQHPDVVKIAWKFGRWHHSVNYHGFKKNKLVRVKGLTPRKTNDEYNMRLKRSKKK